MGAGLLVGTALAVIIPEGMMAICDAGVHAASKISDAHAQSGETFSTAPMHLISALCRQIFDV